MKVLFIASEAMPVIKTGGLADVMGALPKELLKSDVDARVMLPLYKAVKDKYIDSLTLIKDFKVQLSWRSQYCGIFEGEFNGVTYYFLDNEQYFYRDGIYGYYDDGERFAFFAKAALEALRHIDGFEPEILHCSEWQTALIPVYLKTMYAQDEFFEGVKTVFTIHNVEYQGKYDPWIGGDILGIMMEDYGHLEYQGALNFMKGAIVDCDRLTTVSPTYAQELQYPYYANGLDAIICKYRDKMDGIINGIDQELYNPGKDPLIYKNYTSRSPKRKKENKLALQQQVGLIQDKDVPMIGIIGRLASHKGIDIVQFVFDELMQNEVQVAVLGTGDQGYEEFFEQKMGQYEGRVFTQIGFSPDMASKIYASSDLFLMPSKSEPCGLAQMIALRYGTIPVVRETGGLKDSIIPFDYEMGTGNGFTFNSYNAHDMLGAIKRALEVYYDPVLWAKLQKNAFACDFSWEKPAKEYVKLYENILGED